MSKLNSKDYPVGEKVTVVTIDNMEFIGAVEEYTSDAVLINTGKTIAKLYPHEIYRVS